MIILTLDQKMFIFVHLILLSKQCRSTNSCKGCLQNVVLGTYLWYVMSH